MKKTLPLILSIMLIATAAWAGDLASFINLGFSDDSKYFMFGQYGIDGTSSLPYAEIFTIDVPRNEYAPQGVKKASYTVPPGPGQDGHGALLRALNEFAKRPDDPVARYGINHLKTGRMVYLLVNGQEPRDAIEFRDFGSGSSYHVELSQNTAGTGTNVSSSFYINLTVTDKNGNINPRIVGLPNFRRPGVKSYKIRQVIFSPDETSLVFVVEMEQTGSGGTNYRYMVETVKLK